ncbi:hypothetical protein HOY80DRAFT_1022856 [Tuber brumale]|nr:hypothetical protein HOY80DRAFT_1022856 [Tuber brumale]
MAEDQPSFENATQNLHAVAQEISLFPNIPVIRSGNQILETLKEIQKGQKDLRVDLEKFRDDCWVRFDTIEDQYQTLSDEVQTLSDEVQTLSDDVQTLKGVVQTLTYSQDLLPLRLFNSGLSGTGLIKYPHDLDGIERPKTKGDLRNYTKDNCVRLIKDFGLKEVSSGSPVKDFRERIADYLGVVLD